MRGIRDWNGTKRFFTFAISYPPKNVLELNSPPAVEPLKPLLLVFEKKKEK
jgi:hypothetical protein